jgi:hypothetical protein
MSKILLLSLVIFGLSACAVAHDTYLPDGSLGHHISCNGSNLSMGDCMQKAGDICGAAGYHVYKQSDEAVPYTTVSGGQTESYDKSGNHYSSGYSSSSGSIVVRDLFVRCNNGL